MARNGMVRYGIGLLTSFW